MKHKKPRITTILFVLLLLIGVGVLFYPTACDAYTRWQLKKEIGQYNQVTEAVKEDYKELWEAAEEYNRYLAGKEFQFMLSEEELETIPTLLNPRGTGMMGYISIPKIDVNLPVYQGTEEKELQSGTGWWMGSSLPTGGESTHCIITAHTGLVKAKMFTDVDQLVLGDTFTLSILNRELTYEVDQILVTEPEDMSELYIREGEDHVTLYTCTPYGVNTHRLLVRGKRVLTESAEKSEAGHENGGTGTRRSGRIVGIIGILLGLLILGVILWKKKSRKKQEEPVENTDRVNDSGGEGSE